MKTSNSYKDLRKQLTKAFREEKSFSSADVMRIVNTFIERYEIEVQPNDSGKWLLDYIFAVTKIRRKALDKKKLKERLKTYSVQEIKKAILKASKSEHHIDNGFRHMTAEFFTRNDAIIDKWLNAPEAKTEQRELTLKERMEQHGTK